MTAPLLVTRDLKKAFRRAGRPIIALDGVDLSLDRGETLALVGGSGSGKSTLARLVTRLIEPDSGAIQFEGVDLLALRGAPLRALRARLQIVFQEPLEAFNPRATVGRIIADPLRIHHLAARIGRPTAIAALLERVGLPPNLAKRGVHEISGGQRQRVAIARALATSPTLVVLDEAVSALDVTVRAQILDLLRDLQRERGIAYLFITHDLAVARTVAHRIAVMDSGRIVEEGHPDEVLTTPRSPAAAALVAAIPTLRFRPAESASHVR